MYEAPMFNKLRRRWNLYWWLLWQEKMSWESIESSILWPWIKYIKNVYGFKDCNEINDSSFLLWLLILEANYFHKIFKTTKGPFENKLTVSSVDKALNYKPHIFLYQFHSIIRLKSPASPQIGKYCGAICWFDVLVYQDKRNQIMIKHFLVIVRAGIRSIYESQWLGLFLHNLCH